MAKQQLNIQILTLNTALLPKIAGISVGMGNNATRAGNISRLVLENQKSYDVVCFQEAFDTKIIKEHFVKPLAPVYPHYFIDERPGKMGLGVNSGLCIFSKFPIEAKDYENYQCFTGEETFAEKGLRGVKLRVNGQAIYVVTSHLQAGGGPKIIQFISKLIPNFIVARKCECPNGAKPVSTDEVRIAELHQAKKFMDRFSKNEPGPIFFTGDFNINSKLEAQWLEKGLKIFPGVLDTFDPQRAKWNSTTWNPPPTTFPGERNDYIWFINHSTYADGFQGFSQPTILFGEDNSDHLAVEGAFTLSLAVRAKL